jgi:cytochrome c oxidase subunit 1
MGIISEIITNNTRRPLWGYRAAVISVLLVGFMSFIVWAHHMYLTGMGGSINAFFEITTMIISVPSVVLLTVMIASLWGGSIRFTVPMLFAVAFIPMFGIGGLTGLPLGLAMSDIYLHDTQYVLGHFHYIVAPGTIFAVFGGVYYWFPKMTGKRLNTVLGHLHFWPSLVFMNGIFFPMLIQGFAGVSRRLYDGGANYAHAEGVLALNKVMSHSAFALAAVQVFFLVNLAWSLAFGRRTDSNPWEATTLEWAAAPSPPVAHGNFDTVPVVYRGPYEYSVPGAARDFSPQQQPEGAGA